MLREKCFNEIEQEIFSTLKEVEVLTSNFPIAVLIPFQILANRFAINIDEVVRYFKYLSINSKTTQTTGHALTGTYSHSHVHLHTDTHGHTHTHDMKS